MNSMASSKLTINITAKYLNCAILRAGGDDIVVEGTPFDVQDRPLVTRDARIIAIDSSHLEKSLQRSYNNWKIPTEAK